MARKRHQKGQSSLLNQVCHCNAAGIDIAAEELVACVPADRDEQFVRTFSSFTSGLRQLRDWLKACAIDTVAIEATGNYWVAIYQLLEESGIEVYLVNARHVKGVPGRKTDVQDAQWLQQLHAAGLLRKSYRPSLDIIPLRYLMRHRSELIEEMGRKIQHMQKVFNEMNIQLHHVLSDIDGVSGLRIIESILAGERNPKTLSQLRDKRCRTPESVVIEALDGDYRDEYLFVLKQCYEDWQHLRSQIEACDQQISQIVKSVGDSAHQSPCPPPQQKQYLRKNSIATFDIRQEAWRFYGVDLSAIDGISTTVLATLMSEVGTKEEILKSFPTVHHFCSWLGLCPDNRSSGGKIQSAKTRKIVNRLTNGLRMAAQSLWRNTSLLGNFCRKMKARLGKVEGITATAHKLARIIYGMLANHQPYDEQKAFRLPEVAKKKRFKNLKKQAQMLGYNLVPA